MNKGSCLCGAIRFETAAPLKPGACHCSQCRKQSGHYWAAASVPQPQLKLEGTDRITWYRSSPNVQRGFCSVCGSSLFWKQDGSDVIEVAIGAFDKPTEAQLRHHIFIADKGDYYDIADGLPQYPGFPPNNT